MVMVVIADVEAAMVRAAGGWDGARGDREGVVSSMRVVWLLLFTGDVSGGN